MEENNTGNENFKIEGDNIQKETKKHTLAGVSLFVIWDFVRIILIAALIVLPIRYFIFQPFIVKGDSMVPNFHSGDYLIIDELSYRLGEPKRGDVVVLKYPLDPTQRFIKRIIGLPGETVQIKNGKITILKGDESFTLDEKNYLPESLVTDGDVNLTLREGKYFVMGDNRQFSYDSRRWGELPKEDIIGKAFFRVYKNPAFFAAPSY